MYDANAIKIYTDGSAMPNPGCGGVGIVAEYPDSMELDNAEFSEGYKQSTNNRMELLAVITALRWLQGEMRSKRLTRAIIITDSAYVADNYTRAQYWKADGWRNKDGKPYENEDLWDTFLKERHKTKLPVKLEWEKGKMRPVLKRVDALAKQGAKQPTETDYGFKGGKFTAPRTKGGKGPTLFPARGQDALIRIYRKGVYGKGEKEIYKITFDLWDEATKSYTQKHTAYMGKECPDLKRNNCYRATFDSSEAFPQILDATHVEYLRGE